LDKLRSIEAFVVAVEAGSFTAAARQLDITAVMVGKHVRQLEGVLGARLLERSTRSQSLTDTGRRFYEEGKKVLEQLAWAEASVEGLKARPSGTLRVTSATTLGQCVIAPLVAQYQHTHAGVRIELELSNSTVDLADDGFDAAIRVGELDPYLDLVAKPLGHYRMVACASPAYLKTHGTPSTPADLRRHRCLGNLLWTRRSTWVLAGADAPIPWPDDTVFRSNDGPVLRQVALHGGGILLQPRVLVAEDLNAGRLVPLLSDYLPASRPVHLLYRQDRQPLPKTATFIAFLTRHAPKLLA
jgi:DNA-binding transcriptional LysR family regulator